MPACLPAPRACCPPVARRAALASTAPPLPPPTLPEPCLLHPLLLPRQVPLSAPFPPSPPDPRPLAPSPPSRGRQDTRQDHPLRQQLRQVLCLHCPRGVCAAGRRTRNLVRSCCHLVCLRKSGCANTAADVGASAPTPPTPMHAPTRTDAHPAPTHPSCCPCSHSPTHSAPPRSPLAWWARSSPGTSRCSCWCVTQQPQGCNRSRAAEPGPAPHTECGCLSDRPPTRALPASPPRHAGLEGGPRPGRRQLHRPQARRADAAQRPALCRVRGKPAEGLRARCPAPPQPKCTRPSTHTFTHPPTPCLAACARRPACPTASSTCCQASAPPPAPPSAATRTSTSWRSLVGGCAGGWVGGIETAGWVFGKGQHHALLPSPPVHPPTHPLCPCVPPPLQAPPRSGAL